MIAKSLAIAIAISCRGALSSGYNHQGPSRRAGSDRLPVAPAGNHSKRVSVFGGCLRSLRPVLAICVWFAVWSSLSCLVVPAVLLHPRVG